MIFSGRINRVEKPGTDNRFLTTDGEPLPCRQLGVVILNKEPMAAAPLILVEHRTGGEILRLGLAVQFSSDKVADHADTAVLTDDF